MTSVITMPIAGLPGAAPGADEFGGDLARVGVDQLDHGRLQTRPSRASIL